MIKYFLVLSCACAPLLFLCGWNAYELVTAPAITTAHREEDRPNANMSELLTACNQLAAGVLSRGAFHEIMFNRLADANIGELNAAADKSPCEPCLAAAIASREEFRAAIVLMERTVQLPLEPLAWSEGDTKGWILDLEKRAAALRDFCAQCRAEKHGPLVDRLVAAVEEQAAKNTAETAVPKLLEEARLAWQKQRFVDCLQKYREVPVDTVRDPGTRLWLDQRLAVAENVASYWADHQQLTDELGAEFNTQVSRLSSSTADRQLAKIEMFLALHPQHLSDEDQPQHQRLLDRREELSRRCKADERKARLTQDLIELRGLSNLKDIQARARKIALQMSDQDDPLRELGRKVITEWLGTVAFPSKTVPRRLLGNQEAITGNGQRKIGEFRKPPQGMLWRFWSWEGPKDYSVQPNGEDLLDGNLTPALPKYVEWAESFNSECRKLGGNASHQQWLAFVLQCETMQKQLEAYRRAWGVDSEPDRSCKHWSFLPDPTVIPSQNAADLAEQLEWLQAIFEKP